MTAGGYRFLFDVADAGDNRVFHDASQLRRRRARRFASLFLLLAFTWSCLFVGRSIPISTVVEEVRLWWEIGTLGEVEPDPSSHRSPNTFSFWSAEAGQVPDAPCGNMAQGMRQASASDGARTYFGHLPIGLDWAPLSLKTSCGTLGVLLPDWITIAAPANPGAEDISVATADASVREAIESFLETVETPPQLMPTALLETGPDVDDFLASLFGQDTAAKVTRDLLSGAEALNATGICLDFNQLEERQLRTLKPFFESFAAGFRKAGRRSCIALSEGQKVWEDRDLTKQFDTVIVKAFREPWVGSPPGPLSDDAWIANLAQRALAASGPERLTIALGNFAVDWPTGQPLPDTLPVVEAWKRMADAKATPLFSPETSNTLGSYRDAAGRGHKVWLLDAISARNQLLLLEGLGIRNIAIWSLGREDPGLWSVLSAQQMERDALSAKLRGLEVSNYVAYRGEGPFLKVVGRSRGGLRDVNVDPETGRVTGVDFRQLPRPYELERYGRPADNKLVLTFDDGPDPIYTGAILDTLRRTKTPAAFFVVGTSVMEAPDLLKRIVAEGHEIGSHTFSHPRMDQISFARFELEHGMMAKLIAGYTGFRTRLYREPFLRAGGPIEGSGVRSLEWAQNAGGIVAGVEIVPQDWVGLSSAEIADAVVGQVIRGGGNVILLHDGGDDRTATVRALPKIIRTLRAQGYEFTTLADLLGTTRADLMPEASGRWLIFDRLSFAFLSASWLSIETVFWIVLVIGVTRTLAILVLAHLRQRRPQILPEFRPRVTVVIPAFNEEQAVARCIGSVLASDYSNFDVMVIDDGSQDETISEVLHFCRDPRVAVYAQFNQGKWSALNVAVWNARSDIVICIDADTEIDPQAIGHLARQFVDPRVGAVAGKVTVANRGNLLTRLQALEYVTAQNFDRRAFDLVNGIFVVPGAIGAWRTSAVRKAGGFRNDTLTEDADLTIAVNRAGYRVSYEEKAIAYTRAPETVRALLGQRLRWSLGLLQCVWKHKRAFWERRAVGMITIPDMLISGYLFPLLAPVADAFVLLLLYRALSPAWTGEVGVAVYDTSNHLILAYMVLPVLDLFAAAYAIRADKHESLGLLWLFPFQRLFYRQLLYFSVFRSVLRALTGSLAGWGRVSRSRRYRMRRRPA